MHQDAQGPSAHRNVADRRAPPAAEHPHRVPVGLPDVQAVAGHGEGHPHPGRVRQVPSGPAAEVDLHHTAALAGEGVGVVTYRPHHHAAGPEAQRVGALRPQRRRVAGDEARPGGGERLGLGPRLGLHDGEALPAADLPETWLLEARDPLTPQLLAIAPLALPPRALAVAPDGAAAYVLAAGAATRGSLQHLDLTTGAARRLAQLAGPAVDLALAGDRLYAPDPPGDRLWVVDRRSGALLRPVPVGRYPVAVATAWAP